MNEFALATIQADDLEVIQRTAKLLAVSGYFDAKGASDVAIAQVATKILAGRELGFGPFAAVNGIHIIQGKPAVGANLMATAVKSSGRYDYRVKTMSDTEVAIEFFAVGNGKRESLGVSSFTAKDAKAAGTKNMDRYPRNMLFARAMSNGVRFYTPDVFSGNAVYVPEELGAEVDGDGNIVEANFRVVDTSTGEIMHLSPSGDQTPHSAPENGLSDDAGMDGDVLFGKPPWYFLAQGRLQNGVLKFAQAAASYDNDGGPASDKQYQYLTGLLDSTIEQATKAKDGHKRVLAVLCQREIGHDNPPSATLASKLLDALATHKIINGEKIANQAYDQKIVDACITIWRAAEAVATPSLFTQAA